MVARAYPGAAVTIAATSEVGHVAVTLVGFQASLHSQLVLYGESDAFGVSPRPSAAPPRAPRGRIVADMWPLDLHPTVHSQVFFARTICGDLHVLDRGAGRARVAQMYAGVELFGWADWSLDLVRGTARACTLRDVWQRDAGDAGGLWLHSGETRLDGRPVAAVPAGFVGFDPKAADAITPRLANGSTVSWLVVDRSRRRAVCRRWESGRVLEKGRGVLRRVAPVRYAGRRAFASFVTQYSPGTRVLELFGPDFGSKPRKRPSDIPRVGGYECAASYTFVGVRDRALRMLAEPLSPNLIAWHRDDEELWYLSADACEAAAKSATAALAHNPGAKPPGGVHVDCYPELQP